MLMSPPRITGLFYAAQLADYDPRIAGVVAAVEAALPGVHLDHEVTAAGTARRLADRDDFLREASARRALPFVFHGDEARYTGVRGRELPGTLMPGGNAAWQVWVSLPLSEQVGRLDDAVGHVGRAASASWGSASPDETAATIALQTVHPGLARPLPAGLPGLQRPAMLRDAFVPHALGWINYWSETTAHELGFPDPTRDAELLRRSRPIGKAWVVRLTDEPLDLRRADHLAALRDAYERFPTIGGRTA